MPPKRWLTLNGLHGIMPHKAVVLNRTVAYLIGKFPPLLNPSANHHTQDSPLLDPVPSQLSPIHTLHFNIIHASRPETELRSLPSVCPILLFRALPCASRATRPSCGDYRACSACLSLPCSARPRSTHFHTRSSGAPLSLHSQLSSVKMRR